MKPLLHSILSYLMFDCRCTTWLLRLRFVLYSNYSVHIGYQYLIIPLFRRLPNSIAYGYKAIAFYYNIVMILYMLFLTVGYNSFYIYFTGTFHAFKYAQMNVFFLSNLIYFCTFNKLSNMAWLFFNMYIGISMHQIWGPYS